MKMIFFERLHNERRKRGLTQQQLSEISGISRSTIAAYEHNIRKPSYENLLTLADILRISIDYLTGFSDKRLIDTTDLSSSNYHKVITIIESERSTKDYDQ